MARPVSRPSSPSDVQPTRRQLVGPDALRRALADGDAVRLVLVRRETKREAANAAAEVARAGGVAVRHVTEAVLRRLGRTADHGDVLTLVGADPRAGLAETMERPGAVWLLAGLAFPGNVGFAIRTAEVSGATGVVVDSPLEGASRRRALRASMYAQRLFPVLWLAAGEALDAAARTGRRAIAVEDAGDRPPWDVDLTGDVVLVLGGERDGVPADLLARCDDVVRLPMAGFVPSYNVHAAVAAVALERLRQLSG